MNDKVHFSEQHITIDDRTLYVRQYGTGRPSIILEAGAGEASDTWEPIITKLAQHTHAVSYDRAGLGQSTPSTDRTLSRIVSDLATLLKNLAASPPYIFVGHSLGGVIVLHFAQLYPSLVAGLVLLDAPHPRQITALQSIFAALDEPVLPVVAQLRQDATTSDSSKHPEGLDFASSLDLVAASSKVPPVPLTVISRGHSIRAEIPDLPVDVADKLDTMWQILQQDLAQLSPTGALRIATQSGHYIHFDEPELVVTAILDLLADVRNTI